MANGHGGLRIPANPAPVSGPGGLSARTDGKGHYIQKAMSFPTGEQGKWGDRAAVDALQAQAPLAGVGPAGVAGVPGQSAPQATPFSAPTERPNEDVTTYTPPAPVEQMDFTAQTIRAAYAQNPTPYLGSLLTALVNEGR